MDRSETVEVVADCLVRAASTYPDDKIRALERAIAVESGPTARWLLQLLLDNGLTAGDSRSPLCDDTGIPHVLLDVGPSATVTGELIGLVEGGVAEGLRRLPGRPMAVRGDGADRLGQTKGMHDDPTLVEMAPVSVRRVDEDVLRCHVLMLGGGPAIRGRSYRVFHRHDAANVEAQISDWAREACALLGCTPCTIAVGVGRSHYEASNLALQAMVDGRYDVQSDMERRITEAVNDSGIGTMGLGGETTALATFVKIGPARASGVRIVCMRPCCCFEPRVASAAL